MVAGSTVANIGPAGPLVGEVAMVTVLEVPALVLHLTAPVAATIAPASGRPVAVGAIEGETAQAMEAIEGLQGLAEVAVDPAASVRQGTEATTSSFAEEAATTGPSFVAPTIVDATPAEATGLPSTAAVLPVLAETVAGPTRLTAMAVVPRPLGPQIPVAKALAVPATEVPGEAKATSPTYGRVGLVDVVADEATDATALAT